MEAIYETAGRGGGEGEQHPTSLGEEMPLEEECNFLPRPRRGKALPLPFVALYFAECPVRVTDKGGPTKRANVDQRKMQPELFE